MDKGAHYGEEGDKEDSKGVNLFSNDGSFMEQFMKMQQGHSGSLAKPKAEGARDTPNTQVSMKLAPVKKPSPASHVQKRIQSCAARKAFVEGSDSEGEGESTRGTGG